MCVCVVLCRQRSWDGLILRPRNHTVCVYRIKKLKKLPSPTKGCRAVNNNNNTVLAIRQMKHYTQPLLQSPKNLGVDLFRARIVNILLIISEMRLADRRTRFLIMHSLYTENRMERLYKLFSLICKSEQVLSTFPCAIKQHRI
jgi:hypothetical protein